MQGLGLTFRNIISHQSVMESIFLLVLNNQILSDGNSFTRKLTEQSYDL